MPPLVSLNQISCSCPAGLNISLAGSWIRSCSSTDLKRNAVFRLWSVLWQRGPAVTLRSVHRLGGRRRPVTHARHRARGFQREHRPFRIPATPVFSFSCSAELSGCSRRARSYSHLFLQFSTFHVLTQHSVIPQTLPGQVLCARPREAAKVTELKLIPSPSRDSVSGMGMGPIQSREGRALLGGVREGSSGKRGSRGALKR